jgi:hypothetical protein
MFGWDTSILLGNCVVALIIRNIVTLIIDKLSLMTLTRKVRRWRSITASQCDRHRNLHMYSFCPTDHYDSLFISHGCIIITSEKPLLKLS